MNNLTTDGSTDAFAKTRELEVAMEDALEGYGKMLEKAEPSFKATVSELRAQHRAALQDIEALLRDRGARVDADGSIMGAVHKTVVTLRSLVDDVDDDWIPGILDGEKRNLGKYDEAIAEHASDAAGQATLRKHRAVLQRVVDSLGAREPARRAMG